jgi:diguanylate cyclase (GGDEF)-like protein
VDLIPTGERRRESSLLDHSSRGCGARVSEGLAWLRGGFRVAPDLSVLRLDAASLPANQVARRIAGCAVREGELMHRSTRVTTGLSGSAEASNASVSEGETGHGLLEDQTVSDFDQAASDADQAASDGDQAQADADQRSSDQDQAAADRDRAASFSPPTNGVYEASRAARLDGTIDRAQTGRARAQKSAERLRVASSRDENARQRDVNARARDRAAEKRDATAANLDRDRGVGGLSAEEAQRFAAGVLVRAAADRKRAAADREQAAVDRAAADGDRERARRELRNAQLDPLTGAFGRELGMATLEREMNRARRGKECLVLACTDVDGLKQINDRHGHAAGDALLCDVVAAMHTHLRSYDPVVRVGGDEFVCALADCTLHQARERFQHIRAQIEQTQPTASISVGFAPLHPEDTLEQLTERGDRALYAVKHAR